MTCSICGRDVPPTLSPEARTVIATLLDMETPYESVIASDETWRELHTAFPDKLQPLSGEDQEKAEEGDLPYRISHIE
jgi:hypothetical protein